MALQDEKSEIVSFEFEGRVYNMTAQEIEAAFRYQEHQYRLEDAQRWLNSVAFGVDDVGELKDPETEMKDFSNEYGLSYQEAASRDMLERYVSRFESRLDCGLDENAQWEAAVTAVLEDAKEKKI